MKVHQFFIALIVMICTGCGFENVVPSAGVAEVALVQEGKCNCTIIVDSNATPAERYAAEELRTHLSQITGCDIPCKTGVVLDSPMIIVGPGSALAKVEPDLDLKTMGKEELIIRTKGPHLILAGGRPRGTLYAVYEFLEDISAVAGTPKTLYISPSGKRFSLVQLTIVIIRHLCIEKFCTKILLTKNSVRVCV